MTDTIDGLPVFVADIATNMLIEVTKDGQILFLNNKAVCVFGVGGRLPKTIDSIVPKNEISWVMHNIETALYQQYPHHFYWTFSRRFYTVYVYPQDKSVWLCFDDVTEKRKLVHLLHINSQRMRFAGRISRLGYWELDLTKKQFYWSDEMYHIFGISESGKTYRRNLIRELIHHDDLPIYKQKLKDLVRNKQDVEGQLRIVTPARELKYCRFMAGIIYESGEAKIAGAFQDISDLILTQQELEKARKKAEDASLAKSYFLAQAGHDIRQSLHAIALFAEGMQDAPSGQYPAIAAKINTASRNLTGMLNNLLDMSKLEAGEMVCDKQSFNLAELIERVGEEYIDLATEKGIELHVKTVASIVVQDSFLVERIIRNLLANALKFAKKKIILSCQNNSFWVVDDGKGIAKDEQKRIFEMFYQSQASEKRKNGSGLGLYIVSKILSLIGARIDVRSCPEKYTIFKVSL